MKFNYLMLGISSVFYIFAASAMEKQLPSQLPDRSDEVLRIMTYNIRRAGQEKKEERLWHKRLPLVKALIERINPDIMGLQEATAEQIDALRNAFPQFDFFSQGRGASWWGWGTDEHTPLFYDKNKFTLLEHGTFSINPPKGYFGWTPLNVTQTGWLPRICTWGKFKDNTTNKEFYVYNTHLDHSYQSARLSELQVIKDDIMKRAQNLPVVLMGDFNTEFNNELQNIIPSFTLAKNKAKHTFGPQETRTGWDDDELKSIDHILINDLISVKNYGVIAKGDGPYPSDHRPVIADISLRK